MGTPPLPLAGWLLRLRFVSYRALPIQIIDYAERALLAQPHRKVMWGILCDCTIVQFFRVIRGTDGTFKHERTASYPLSGEQGLPYLAQVLRASKRELGSITYPEYPFGHVSVIGYLGSGSSADVFEVVNHNNGKSYAWKRLKPAFEDKAKVCVSMARNALPNPGSLASYIYVNSVFVICSHVATMLTSLPLPPVLASARARLPDRPGRPPRTRHPRQLS